MSDPILTIKDVADYLKVNERTIYRLAASGDLPGFKVGNSWRFKQSELEQYIAARHNRGSFSEAMTSAISNSEDN
ncbi:helix-turn-helix domain-containing protein [Teredinibacter turnerae]|uniref:DNA binding domain protein, excisionase family n=1 Tax=Teredinibacter turnerae (strain ATCC 39867 / T7901) TaxID=377629 RepID=C5BTJ7_TERTT|nr:helix-turn-helix domain-containing protein [Teredinibacter turnerae]ACR12484.1 DNA binding domain protein, excisionase family [Teredinibacter turnerae T7901]